MSLYKQFFNYLYEGTLKKTNKKDLDETSDELALSYMKAAERDIKSNPKKAVKRRKGQANALGVISRNYDKKHGPILNPFGAIPKYYNDPKEPRPYTGD